MKYVMSMAANTNHLKQMIMADTEMSDMEKLHDVFCVDKDELKERFPQLYCAILAVLETYNSEAENDCFDNELLERIDWDKIKQMT